MSVRPGTTWLDRAAIFLGGPWDREQAVALLREWKVPARFRDDSDERLRALLVLIVGTTATLGAIRQGGLI